MWGPNLCNAVSGWLSLIKRGRTPAGTLTCTYTFFLYYCFAGALACTHTHTHTRKVVRHGTGQIKGFGLQEFSIIALKPGEHERMTIKTNRGTTLKITQFFTFSLNRHCCFLRSSVSEGAEQVKERLWEENPGGGAHLHKHQTSHRLQEQRSCHGNDVNS